MSRSESAPGSAALRAGGTLTVDLDAIAANWRMLAERVAPARTGAVVKANAYGLGVAPVADALANAGCDTFFVALPDEGRALREILANAEIYVFEGLLSDADAELIAEHRLVPVLNDREQLERYRAFATRRDARLPCAIHIDTGMNRLGFGPSEAKTLADDPGALTGLDVRVVMSHLASANDAGEALNERQRSTFAGIAGRIGRGAALSLANSGGIFLGAPYHFDLVRPGAALYGLAPLNGRPNPMRRVVSLTAPIVQVRNVDSPGTVGYGATHRVAEKAKIAVVSIGYADGYGFSLSNRGHAFLGSARLPVVGRISMDLITLDATEVPSGLLHPGAEVELIGPNISPDDLARTGGTIGYEVLTRLGPRLRRRYIGGATTVGSAD
ncbi:MAG: alanine racemase [Gemmatimonas sp.]